MKYILIGVKKKGLEFQLFVYFFLGELKTTESQQYVFKKVLFFYVPANDRERARGFFQ